MAVVEVEGAGDFAGTEPRADDFEMGPPAAVFVFDREAGLARRREVRIGGTVLRVVKPVERCAATTANPETGARDADTLGALDSFGHQNFSVLGEVILGGDIHTGDAVALIP